MMKPMTLKEPTACCGSPTLLWIREKREYACPCGKMRTDMEGRVLGPRGPRRIVFGRKGKRCG